jgi:nitrate reductase gamma subunit
MSIFLFIVFPYVAVILAVGVSVYRFRTNRYSYSSVSSQLLENTKLFWGSVPWHYGITLILLAHLFAWLFPGWTGSILGHGTRLFVFEAAGLALAFFAAVGLVVLIARRLPQSRARAVTSPMDWVVLMLLLVQVLTGAAVALFDRWGSQWFLSTAAPWLWSLVRLHPDASAVAPLPALIQVHILCGFAIILLIPFSRLVHFVMVPIYYLWRPYQVVVWYRDPRRRLAPTPSGASGAPVKSSAAPRAGTAD